jgi:hypothetical protein
MRQQSPKRYNSLAFLAAGIKENCIQLAASTGKPAQNFMGY